MEYIYKMIGAPRKYLTDRERTAALRQQKNFYANKKFYQCEKSVTAQLILVTNLGI